MLELVGVGLTEDETLVLHDVDWRVEPGERWVVLGPNGAGKTSLLRIASLYRHPSVGELRVLGGVLGRIDVRTTRASIGLASHALGDQLRRHLTALDAVMTAKFGALEPWWHTYDDHDRADARRQLERFAMEHRVDHRVGDLSAGERQRVLLARAFAAKPRLVLLDEPTAGLDLPGREDLVQRLGVLAADPGTAPIVLVTHHVEEIPAAFTHTLLLRKGEVFFAGPLTAGITSKRLSELFDLDLDVVERNGRYSALAR